MIKKDNYDKNFLKKHGDLLICIFLVLSTLSVYWKVHNYDFVNFDDDTYVTENRHVQTGLSIEGIKWAFTTNHASNWHPLTWLSHMLDFQLYGMNPGRHHLTNLLFHMANTLLLFFVFRNMTGYLWRSAFVAALFALHPLHVESVAWISERKDVLSAFFWILTTWSYIEYVKHPRINKYLLVILFFILGLMSKPMLVTLPFVLLLLDFYPLSRFHKSADKKKSNQRSIAFNLVLEKIPLFVIVIISSIITYYAQKHGGSLASLDVIPIKVRISNALVSYADYILKTIYPSKLAVLYPHPVIISWWKITGACLLLLSVSFFAIRAIKKSPYFIVGWLWYLGTLVPVIGLVQVGSQSMADRYTYIPLIGIFIIISWGISEFSTRWNRLKIVFTTTSIAILFILMTITFLQTRYWKDSITLFEHTLGVTFNNHIAHNTLGMALYERDRFDDAIKHYEEALRINPDYEYAHYNLAISLQGKGLVDDAIKHYEEALRINPDYEKAHNNFGVTLKGQGHIEDAIRHYEEALRIEPDYEEAHNNLGNILKEQGLVDDAIKHYEEALRINPDYGGAHYNLAVSLQGQGRIEDAVRHYEEVLRINPDYEEAHNNLAIALIYQGEIDVAIVHFRKAIEINPDYVDAKINLKKALLIQEQRK